MHPFEVRESTIHGRGCFATRDISSRESFTFPVLVVEKTVLDSIMEMTFPWAGKKQGSIVLGAVTLCNASSTPNLAIDTIDKIKMTKTFTAVKDIAAGEEVTLSYRAGH